MKICNMVLRHDLKEELYKQFIKDAKYQLKSVSKQRVDFSEPAYKFGGCFTYLPKNVSYQDIEDLIEGCGEL